MDATMLLCDAAEEVNGKLYIIGGGWSVLWIPYAPTNMAVAVKLSVPWDQTNRPHDVGIALMTDDGEVVDLGSGPVGGGGQIEVGRPAGVKPGTALDVPFVVKFNGLALPPGGYRWELEIDGSMIGTVPFRVMTGLPGQPPVQPTDEQ